MNVARDPVTPSVSKGRKATTYAPTHDVDASASQPTLDNPEGAPTEYPYAYSPPHSPVVLGRERPSVPPHPVARETISLDRKDRELTPDQLDLAPSGRLIHTPGPLSFPTSASRTSQTTPPSFMRPNEQGGAPTEQISKPRIRKVILTLGKPPEPLEGGIGRENAPKPNTSPTPGHEVTKPPVSHKASVHNKDLQRDVIQTTPNASGDEERVRAPNTMSTPPFDSLLENPPTLTEIISYGDPSSDIHECVMNRYREDPFFSKIAENPGTFRNFEPTWDRTRPSCI
ncbi:hypothetical protein EDD22DRAFT_843949 [Suillus occidentalis]|nr:hypothetical protein EDD22DRAFT_843949 [Suillus occidentalis]